MFPTSNVKIAPIHNASIVIGRKDENGNYWKENLICRVWGCNDPAHRETV